MIYFDNAATSFPKAPGVPEAVYDFLKNVGANAGRSSSKAAVQSSRILFDTRELIAELFGIVDDSRVLFTSGTTEALNTAVFGLVKENHKVLISCLEHNSVIRPLNYLKETRNIEIEQFGINDDFTIDYNDFLKKLDDNPDVLIFSGASNVTGTILPFEKLALEAKKRGCMVILDAAQLAGYVDFEIKSELYDCVCVPGHKGLLGPTGTGFLWISEKIDFDPLKFGGTGSVSDSEYQPDFYPDKFESGTQNISGIAGLKVGIEFLFSESIKKIRKHKMVLSKYLINRLSKIENIELKSCVDIEKQVGVISFIHKKRSVSEITRQLDLEEIAVRMGLHCSPLAHKAIGTFESGGTIRLSPGYFNTLDECKFVCDFLEKL